MTTVLGIDSSLTSTGVCRVKGLHARDDDGSVIDTWRVLSKPGTDRGPVGMSNRIAEIIAALDPHIAEADLVVLEGISFSSIGTGAHALHWLWGRIVDATVDRAVELRVVSPSQRMKYATGRGNAAKDMVLAATIRRWPDVDIDGNDTADALVLAAIGCRYLGLPIDDVPKAHWGPVMEKALR